MLFRSDDAEAMRFHVQEAAVVELPALERRLGFLAAIAQVAPLVGLLGTVLDGVATAACYIDAEERIQSWNRTYEDFFPEHKGLLRRGWPYAENLRRYFEANSSVTDPVQFEEILTAGVARHRNSTHSTLFQKRDGRRLRSQIFRFADGA